MKKSRFIIATTALVSAALIVSVATTVAWYERSNRLQVNSVDITFRGQKDLQIGLTPDDLKDEIRDFEDNLDYIPVSSMFSSSWLEAKSSTPKFRKAYRYYNTNNASTFKESEEASEGYFQSEFYLYSSSAVYASIAPDSLIVANEEANLAKARAKYPNDEAKRNDYLAKLNNTIKSLRLSVLVPDEEDYSYTIIDPFKGNNETYLCGKLDIDKDGYYEYGKIDGSTKEVVFGEYQNDDKIVYDAYSPNDSEMKNADEEASVFNSKTKRNVDSFNFEESVVNGFVPVKEESIKLEDTNTSLLIPLKAREAKKVVLSIYFEGWDLDNIDSIISGSFNANIAFNIARDRVVHNI